MKFGPQNLRAQLCARLKREASTLASSGAAEGVIETARGPRLTLPGAGRCATGALRTRGAREGQSAGAGTRHDWGRQGRPRRRCALRVPGSDRGGGGRRPPTTYPLRRAVLADLATQAPRPAAWTYGDESSWCSQPCDASLRAGVCADDAGRATARQSGLHVPFDVNRGAASLAEGA